MPAWQSEGQRLNSKADQPEYWIKSSATEWFLPSQVHTRPDAYPHTYILMCFDALWLKNSDKMAQGILDRSIKE